MNIKCKSTLEKFEKILNLRNYSNKTIEVYKNYIYHFIKSLDKPALHITSNDIRYYLENYEYSSIPQQNQIYSSLKLFCKYILKIKFLDKIFLERPRKQNKIPRVIEKDSIIKSLDKINNVKHRAILSLAYSVGLRISEVINLKINDIDSKRMIIHIRNAKGGKDRVVPLSQNLLYILRDYYKKYKPKTYLFNGQDSLQYSSTSARKIYKKYIDEKTSFHNIRHSCFTNLLENGTDIRIIQKLAGHKSSKTTEIYTHVSNNLLKQIKLPI